MILLITLQGITAFAQFTNTPINGNSEVEINNPNKGFFTQNSPTSITVDIKSFDAMFFSTKTRIIIPHFSLPNHSDVILSIDKFEAVAPDAKFILGDSTGLKNFRNEPGIFFKGTIVGMDSSHVFLAVFRNYCFGIIETNYTGGENNPRYQILPHNYNGFGQAEMSISEITAADLSLLSGSEICHTLSDSVQNSVAGNRNKH